MLTNIMSFFRRSLTVFLVYCVVMPLIFSYLAIWVQTIVSPYGLHAKCLVFKIKCSLSMAYVAEYIYTLLQC